MEIIVDISIHVDAVTFSRICSIDQEIIKHCAKHKEFLPDLLKETIVIESTELLKKILKETVL